jgi:hypothetical protein
MSDPSHNQKVTRDYSLDLLRGVAVAGMFFFSLVATFSDSLPLLLLHNIPGRFLPGDLVLSLFLFSSGVSLSLMRQRYASSFDSGMWLKLIRRLSWMVLVSLFITPFSVGEPFGMDEMMLNLVLTIPALFIIGLGEFVNLGAIFFIWVLIAVLGKFGQLVDPTISYLGGYPLCFAWMPMVLAGSLTTSRNYLTSIQRSAIWIVTLLILCIFSGPPDKLNLAPSFGALSALIGELFLDIFKRSKLRLVWLEYFGSKPLRMWVLMFALLGPLRFYAETSLNQSQLTFRPAEAVSMALLWMLASYGISKGIDRVRRANASATGR